MIDGAQIALFGREDPAFDPSFARLERTELGRGAWIDRAPGWVEGHASLMRSIADGLQFRAERRVMYDRVVDVPRLLARHGVDGTAPPLVLAMRDALAARYRVEFDAISFALYRNGEDSVAWHGDREPREWKRSLVAIVSLGAARKFLLRPSTGGTSIALSVGLGDLLVMGGTIQRTWQHAVPKVKHAEPRLSIMFRHRAPLAPLAGA